MKKGKVKITGHEWDYFLHTEKDFIKAHPDCADSGAVTLPSLKELHFMILQLDIGTIRHEVRHAFISELCFESADLSLEQFEEVNCTLDQNRWDEMGEVSAIIYENLALT